MMTVKQTMLSQHLRLAAIEIENDGTASQVGPEQQDLVDWSRRVDDLIIASDGMLKAHAMSYDPVHNEAIAKLKRALARIKHV